jgi:hypothetical protein
MESNHRGWPKASSLPARNESKPSVQVGRVRQVNPSRRGRAKMVSEDGVEPSSAPSAGAVLTELPGDGWSGRNRTCIRLSPTRYQRVAWTIRLRSIVFPFGNGDLGKSLAGLACPLPSACPCPNGRFSELAFPGGIGPTAFGLKTRRRDHLTTGTKVGGGRRSQTSRRPPSLFLDTRVTAGRTEQPPWQARKVPPLRFPLWRRDWTLVREPI